MVYKISLLIALLLQAGGECFCHNQEDTTLTSSSFNSVFMTEEMVKNFRHNAGNDLLTGKIINEITEAAKPWLSFTEDQLWEMMFGNTIRRSWMVWSDGYCPSCRKGVPMYQWLMDPFNKPWKVTCPHCMEDFPKNDFGKYYLSGMDEHYVFDPSKADRSLLFNTEHPEKSDPLHEFGVDDGEGWAADGHRWRFIGAYLIYGQWKRLIIQGIINLSEAYTVTGDEEYSYRAGILLDRVADLYPSFDFSKEGLVYENPGFAGYVSTWHDACQETRQLAIAYDMVRKQLSEDNRLSSFLAEKADKYNLVISKSTPSGVVANIDNGLLSDPQKNRSKIYSNYPQKDMTLAILKNIAGRPGDRDSVLIILDSLIKVSTAVDGLTGEKGLTGYSAYGAARMAEVLSLFSRPDPGFLKRMISMHPAIIDMFRFYIDVWSGMKYYPNIGDCDGFALPDSNYKGLVLRSDPGLNPSMYSFLWKLYEETKDPAFVQVMYHANGRKSEGLPYDIFSSSPEKIRSRIDKVVKKHGLFPETKSVNKKEWHLAVLRDGTGEAERALWLDYDAGGYHSHADGLNTGLFAYGLDLLPDFGYPPVQFGGWESGKANWYKMTAAHNTVVVDGKNQNNLAGSYNERKGFQGEPAGKTTLWADGITLKAVRAELPEAYDIQKYERSLAMVNAGNDDFYVIDLFSIHGGNDHAKMTYSAFGEVSAKGLNTAHSKEYGYGTILEKFHTDTAPQPGWYADWKIDDRFNMSSKYGDIHLRLTDLSEGVTVSLADAWIVSGFNATEGEWIPSVVTRRIGHDSMLVSEFVSVIEPYCSKPFISSSDRKSAGNGYTAVEINLADGTRDLWITGNREEKQCEFEESDGSFIRFKGDMVLIRRDASGGLKSVSFTMAEYLSVGEYNFSLIQSEESVELSFPEKRPVLLSGNREIIKTISFRGNPVSISSLARNKR